MNRCEILELFESTFAEAKCVYVQVETLLNLHIKAYMDNLLGNTLGLECVF